jgi:hypothetical protein
MRRMLFVLAAAAAVAGCASRPEPVVSFPPVEHWQEIMVQTIPRGCWVEHNSGYVGVAPIAVRVRSSERGRPMGINAITVTHSSGAWERKMVRYGEPVPERMLFDLAGLVGGGPGA